jgi:hypothetical protein
MACIGIYISKNVILYKTAFKFLLRKLDRYLKGQFGEGYKYYMYKINKWSRDLRHIQVNVVRLTKYNTVFLNDHIVMSIFKCLFINRIQATIVVYVGQD